MPPPWGPPPAPGPPGGICSCICNLLSSWWEFSIISLRSICSCDIFVHSSLFQRQNSTSNFWKEKKNRAKWPILSIFLKFQTNPFDWTKLYWYLIWWHAVCIVCAAAVSWRVVVAHCLVDLLLALVSDHPFKLVQIK